MTRKQLYVLQTQEILIDRLARSRKMSKGEVIHQTLEREISGPVEQSFVPDPDALRRVIEAGLDRRTLGITGESYRWKREDAYEERLSRYDRRGEL